MTAAASSTHLDDLLESLDGTASPPSLPDPTHIDPVLSLELRLRWLEALLLGVRPEQRRPTTVTKDRPELLKPGTTLVQLADHVQRQLDAVLASNDSLHAFMQTYDQHAQWLTPAFALSGTLPSYAEMDPDALDALLAEMEPDIRTAERDMREIALLEDRGVLAAGKLADYEPLQPRLRALLTVQEEDTKMAAALERRIAHLVEHHATHVDTLSELFVAWDDVLTETESKIKRLERDKEDRQRLGYA